MKNLDDKWIIWGIIGFFLVVGLIFVFIGSRDFWERQQLKQQGIITPAQIVSSKENSSKGTTTYDITYRYTAQNGQSYQRSEGLDQRAYYGLAGALRVTYLPDNPAVARLTIYLDKTDSWLLPILIGLASWIPAIIFAVLMLRQSRRQRQPNLSQHQ